MCHKEKIRSMISVIRLARDISPVMFWIHREKAYLNRTQKKALMTKKKFLNSVTNSQEDIAQQLLDLLKKLDVEYCVIGGLAVNAYAEPVVSLDLDIVVIAEALDALTEEAKKLFTIEEFPHSLNLKSPKSDLRIQIQTDPCYQAFIKRASVKMIMDYEMKVASIQDVLQEKVWAYSDKTKRASKRQKDLADIAAKARLWPTKL
jgi:hypothetical protein